jgi:plasmid stabilization system protein ParE
LSRPVRVTPLAEVDIAAAQDDYEARQPGLGNRFVEHVRTTLTRIGNNPFRYQVIKGTREHRRAPVHQLPFGIWYRVEPDESVVVACLAIARTSRVRVAERCGSTRRNAHNTELMLFIDIEMFKKLTGSATDAMRAFHIYAGATWERAVFEAFPRDALEDLTDTGDEARVFRLLPVAHRAEPCRRLELAVGADAGASAAAGHSPRITT